VVGLRRRGEEEGSSVWGLEGFDDDDICCLGSISDLKASRPYREGLAGADLELFGATERREGSSDEEEDDDEGEEDEDDGNNNDEGDDDDEYAGDVECAASCSGTCSLDLASSSSVVPSSCTSPLCAILPIGRCFLSI